MDYNYIRLENMIKQLMNKAYVPSSSRAKSTEEIYNGSCRCYIDTILNQFIFKYSNLTPSLLIDPVNRSLLNVQYINNIDISKLIGGIEEGYGISITNKGNGIYQANVKEGMFALKTDFDILDKKFDDCATIEELERDYATKSELKVVDDKFANYSTTLEIQENYLDKSYIDVFNNKFKDYPTLTYSESTYATKTELNQVTEKFDNYPTKEFVEETYMKRDDIVPPSETQFEKVDGFPAYYVKSGDIYNYSPEDISPAYNIMQINISNEELVDKIKASTTKIAVFKISLRKQLLLDYDWNILNDFVVYFDNETSKFESPRITSR